MDEQGCPMPTTHDAHLAANGECPWCLAVDRSAIRSDLTLEQIEREYGN